MPFVLPRLVTIPSASFDKRSLVPICLLASHLPFGAHLSFLASHLPFSAHLPFLASHLPFGTHMPCWHLICLLAPHLPFGTPFAFFGIPFAFQRPICLLQAPSAFWLPKFFLKRPMTKCLAAKRGPDFNSHPRVQFVGDIIIMCNNQSALPTASAIFAASFPRVRMCLDPSHHFVWAHRRDFSLRSSTWNLFR